MRRLSAGQRAGRAAKVTTEMGVPDGTQALLYRLCSGGEEGKHEKSAGHSAC